MGKRCMIVFLVGITILLSGCTKQQQLSIADRTTRGETNIEPQENQDNEESDMIQELDVVQESDVIQESDATLETETSKVLQESSTPSSDEEITYITEKLFITQINHIYYNAQDYLGKTIEYEGIFETYQFEDTNQSYYYVVRYGPGCCSNDSSAGFEIAWDEDNYTKPEENAWVKVRGVLQEYQEGEYTYLRLNVVSLEEMETRGQEYVED